MAVSVERKVGGRAAAVTWWVDDVVMSELERHKKKIAVPDVEKWNRQIYCVRVFDQLIYNVDRNLGNLLITEDWKTRMIDHTRSFRLHKKLKNEKNLLRCDRGFLSALRGLDYETLEAKLRPYLAKTQIRALLARRNRILEYFDEAIAEKGEEAVLFDLERGKGRSGCSGPAIFMVDSTRSNPLIICMLSCFSTECVRKTTESL